MTFTPKYKPEQIVWALLNGKALQLPIDQVEIKWKTNNIQTLYWFKLEKENSNYDFTYAEEPQIFLTKEELINSL